MKKIYCIIPQILLLFWFFLDMTGVHFGNIYLVTRSYKDDGIFFIIYLATVILFIFTEKAGKWAVAIWTSIWFVIQFLCHEWYTIFGKGIMGSLEGKIKFFSGTIKWLEIDGRYIPDVYHTVLHILILAVIITSAIYIKNSKKRNIASDLSVIQISIMRTFRHKKQTGKRLTDMTGNVINRNLKGDR